MNFFKRLFSLVVLFVVMVSFSQCSSVPKLHKEADMNFGDVYYQEWNSGIQGGGSGINLFITVVDSEITLDKVYFRGRVSKLEAKPSNPNLFIGRFKTELTYSEDIILSSDPKEEYTNKIPQKEKSFPFELKANECVASYITDGRRKYFKISDIRKEPSINYPSAQPEQD